MSLTAHRKVPMIAGQDLSISLSQTCDCEQCSLVSEGDSEGDVVKLVHLLMMWRDRLSVKGTKPAIPNTLKKDVLAGGHVSCLLFNSEVFKPFMLGIYMPQGL